MLASADAAEARKATPEQKEAARLAYEAQKARHLVEQEARKRAEAEAEAEALRQEAEETAALEDVLAEAEKACGYRNFARASVLCAQLKGTEDWPQSEKLQMGVARIEAIIQDYVARHQQAQAVAAWQAELTAQRTALLQQQVQARAQAQQAGAAVTPLERALGMVGSNRRHYCRECGEYFTGSRREHETVCPGHRSR